MPETLKQLGKPDFTTLKPDQVRISTVVEFGGDPQADVSGVMQKAMGGGVADCVFCDHCVGCDCFCEHVDPQFKLDTSVSGPVKIAREVIYELIEEANSEHGKCELTQTRVIVEMSEQTYRQMPGKENFVDLGTAGAGTNMKQYLLKATRGPLHNRKGNPDQ